MNKLVLPTRYETLRATAEAEKVDITRIVVPVEHANRHIQEIFLRIEQTRVGRFEVLYGESGCGKTTFLETLPCFFDGLTLQSVPGEIQLVNAVGRIREIVAGSRQDRVVVYLGERDNPLESDDEFFTFFERLRSYFREQQKPVLVVWPVSREPMARKIYGLADEIGADSLVGDSRANYHFGGPPKSEYYSIADQTTRLMNREQSLLEFGIDEDLGTGVLCDAPTIAQYFQKIIGHSDHLNATVGNLLTQKPRPRVWILVPGDEITELMSTVRALTTGTQRKLDVAALTTEMAETQASTQYMKNWDHIRKYVPYFLRSLDVRVVELPPNVALAIVRAFGGDLLRNRLKKNKEAPAVAVKALRESMLGELILAEGPRERRQLKRTAEGTRDEFVRIQSTAKGDDKPLNDALGMAVEKLLAEHARGRIAVGKKQPIYGSLKPDIHIELEPSAPLCIEVTWRATGHQVEGVQRGKQNTLTPGHIRQYTLAKAYEYVKALGLDTIAGQSV